jgi:hypothetical protein
VNGQALPCRILLVLAPPVQGTAVVRESAVAYPFELKNASVSPVTQCVA